MGRPTPVFALRHSPPLSSITLTFECGWEELERVYAYKLMLSNSAPHLKTLRITFTQLPRQCIPKRWQKTMHSLAYVLKDLELPQLESLTISRTTDWDPENDIRWENRPISVAGIDWETLLQPSMVTLTNLAFENVLVNYYDAEKSPVSLAVSTRRLLHHLADKGQALQRVFWKIARYEHSPRCPTRVPVSSSGLSFPHCIADCNGYEAHGSVSTPTAEMDGLAEEMGVALHESEQSWEFGEWVVGTSAMRRAAAAAAAAKEEET
ncbi:uncharacterized protein LTR77_005812 [Saxophila tyrrhenica]|uniref:Uncharacterized protein n=1 Tax=Saxophila tyrrhenica TaxID=1690608 RepID=A0AAV9PCK4_9PEZI|nr:hypothetical protein LTR77_005812 [Saxophila tyrrhenica]